MSEWNTFTMAEVAEGIYDGPHATPKKTASGPIFLGISSLNSGRLDLTDTEHLSEEDFTKWTKRITPKTDDLVFSYETRLGECALIPEGLRCCLGRRMALVRPNRNIIDPKFLLYRYLSPQFQAFVRAHAVPGSTVDRISLTEFPGYEIEIPSLSEQRFVAETLSSLDEKIELNRKQNRTLEAIAQALFKRWFVEFEFPDENGRPYKSSGGTMKPSELGEIPVGWEVTRIGDFVEVTDYVANGSFESLRNNVSLYDDPEYALFVRATDYKGGFSGKLKYTDQSSYEFLKKTVLTGDEIIISNVGDIGSVFRPPVWLDQPMTLGSNLIALRSDFNPYLFQLFRSHYGQFLISGLVGGSAQPKFNKTEFRSLEVVLPDRSLLKQYTEFELALWDKQIVCNRGNKTLAELRDTLLPKLMSGELRVGVAA